MGHHNYQQNHQAIDGLVNLFTKANHDLTMIQYKLEKEFQQIYPDNVSKANINFFLMLKENDNNFYFLTENFMKF